MLNFLQQMSGAAGIRYYLPANFKAAGTSDEIALLASGIDGSVQVACTVVGLLLVDRVGRRHALGFGAALMAFCLMVSLPPFDVPQCAHMVVDSRSRDTVMLTQGFSRSMVHCKQPIRTKSTKLPTTAISSSFSYSH